MKPTTGRVVLAVGGVAESNGTQVAPAIITRVWSPREGDGAWCVNATVFPDAASPVVVTSAYLYHDQAAAVEARDKAPTVIALYWPPRV